MIKGEQTTMTETQQQASKPVTAAFRSVPQSEIYKFPSNINIEDVNFKVKPDKVGAAPGPIKLTIFNIEMPPDAPKPEPVVETVPEGQVDDKEKKPKPIPKKRKSEQTVRRLLVRPERPVWTKYGLKAGHADRAVETSLNEDPDSFDDYACGIAAPPKGVHFTMLVYLDPDNEEDQKLIQFSESLSTHFEDFLSKGVGTGGLVKSKKFETKSFVSQSEASGSYYIACSPSIKHVLPNGQCINPTPFTDPDKQFLIWSQVAGMSFNSIVDLKIDAFAVRGNKSASCRVYLNSCQLIENPKPYVREGSGEIAAGVAYEKAMRKAAQSRGIKKDEKKVEGDTPVISSPEQKVYEPVDHISDLDSPPPVLVVKTDKDDVPKIVEKVAASKTVVSKKEDQKPQKSAPVPGPKKEDAKGWKITKAPPKQESSDDEDDEEDVKPPGIITKLGGGK